MGRDKKTEAWKKGQWTSTYHRLITHHTQAIYTCVWAHVFTHTHTQFMDYFFVNSSCPWQNANNVQISYWVNYQINSWTAFVYIISDARNPQILSVSNSPDWPETCSNPPLSLWSARIRGTKCYMTSYNLSSVVAIAKKMIRKENSRVSICIISKFTNSLVYMASSKTAKSYIGTGLKIQKKKKKPSHVKNASPIERST